MVSIAACPTRKLHRQFERVAELLHRDEPAFVPPFPGSVAKYLASSSAFRQRHGDIYPFIAWRNGRPVGRIAAIVNRSHNTYHNDRAGFFGFFECENNPETARLLFEKAAEVLREQGLESMRGPYNPSINDECGLLVDGFEDPPFIGLTWNPPYYEALVEGNGFRVVTSSTGFRLALHKHEPPDRLRKIMERAARRSRLTLRPINLSRLDEELKIVQEVYNATLERNWGFVPIAMEDLLFAADDLRAIADPNMILIAEMEGQNAGVALSLPNFNEYLLHSKSTPYWLRPLHVLWLMKTRRLTTGRQVVYGISPRYRDRGLHGWLLYEHFVTAKRRYTDAELGWVEDSNTEILGNAEMLGAVPYRRWRIYEAKL